MIRTPEQIKPLPAPIPHPRNRAHANRSTYVKARCRLSAPVLQRRLMARITVTTPHECWPWNGGSVRGGYGRLWDGQRLQQAQRLTYEVFCGPIPAGHHVLHTCDNPPCNNPSHLFTGTVAQNMADRDRKGRHRSGGHKLKGRPSQQRGELHAGVKLCEPQVLEIRRRGRAGERGTDLAREFDVSSSLVYGILDGRNWGWLDEAAVAA